MLDSYKSVDQCLTKVIAKPTSFAELFDGADALWPDNLRCRVEALFSNAPLAEMMEAVKDHLLVAPSPKSVFMLAVYTGQGRAPATSADGAFSMTGNLYGGPWTMWDSPAMDAENVSWHEGLLELLKPYVAGHYIGETDIVDHPENARLSYSAGNWQRLIDLRRKHDPDGLFFGFSNGLN